MQCNWEQETEKWPIFYIGKLKQLWCFGKKTPKEHGFLYHNNITSWMTSEIFEQYVFFNFLDTLYNKISTVHNKMD